MTTMYKNVAYDGKARAGVVTTAHGEIETPIFMPVGTRASVKCMWQHELEEVGAQIILGNTYHLYLRPGHELIEKVGGGLHGFMNWKKPILTDSGGYQVFSLSSMNKLSEEGVRFQSHIDGSYHMISPEKSMEIQRALGSDIVMNFDECPALPATKERLRESMELTLRWAKRCRDYELKEHQNLFGIIQGGLHFDLRTECMERLTEMNFEGYALGGLSVGEKNEEMVEFCSDFVHTMPKDKPRYLMGVGKPLDILTGIKNGLDMFDCVLPTRNARNGQFLTHHGPLNIKKERFKEDTLPPDPDCSCKVCSNYSRSYIRHLYNTGEYLAGQLISYHNLHFFLDMTKQARAHIIAGTFDEYYKTFYNNYTSNQWT
ncbi:tRNA guanosine(34) transglycosylase Tgt [Halobacteriovorax marinus]|uniref:Queuine tRNA-ribosyltransferase n=1 Tax=Halobacteriovorax marinus (strain ATCC BAA-682 / DSM 15412 / SJ) TaxID=862908 RepID=E1X0T3_HALMS|nr:tRNA guanosine(34) transglycosylase Tgt [Halobacteriovorax marinus]ATH07780.1 tRNA guanosine(34) transglycosylase Tgt [Halobacteriovorax marinus]CBW26421.1 queuine tRNA-ribosyltransferase [Halobacteriovorax marinus SJ]